MFIFGFGVYIMHILNRSLLTTTCAHWTNIRIKYWVLCKPSSFFALIWSSFAKHCKIHKKFLYVSAVRFSGQMMMMTMYLCMQWIWCAVRTTYIILAFENDHHYFCWQFLLNFLVRNFCFFLLFIFRSSSLRTFWSRNSCACSEMWMHFWIFELMGPLKCKQSYNDLNSTTSIHSK